MSVRIRQWIGFLIMVVGLGFLSSPFLVGAYHEMTQKSIVADFRSMEQPRKEAAPGTTASAPEKPAAPETQPETVPAGSEPNALPEDDEPAQTAGQSEEPEKTEPEKPETTEPETTAPEAPTEQETEAPSTAPTEPAQILPHQDFYDAAVAYNASLCEGEQNKMGSLQDLEKFDLDSRDYGFAENIIGTIRIPRLDLELGLYLGASGANMAKGAALFGLTSVPLGQPDENAAIAGHRGWRGTPMFRDIQRIQMKDPVYITTPWAELEYKVCGIEIVTPDNINWCKIHPGRTLITLMTCHPYGKNYQRYIVYAELVPPVQEELQHILHGALSGAVLMHLTHTDGEQENVVVEPSQAGQIAGLVTIIHADGSREDAWAEENTILLGDGESVQMTPICEETVPPEETPAITPVTVVHDDGTREEVQVDASAIAPDGSEYGAVLSNVVILAEDKMRPIACAMAVLVALVGIWLTVQTVKDARKRKGA